MTAPALRSRPGGRPAGIAVVVAACALLLGVLPAAAAGSAQQAQLSQGSASPTTATTAQPVTFTVTYSNGRKGHGVPANWVRVVLDAGASGSLVYPMVAGAGDPSTGQAYSLRTTLPAGKHAVEFQAAWGTRGTTYTLAGPTVTITAAQTPTPKPTPKPTPRPTPAPTPTATPAPGSTPTDAPTPSSAPVAAPSPTSTPVPSSSAPALAWEGNPGGGADSSPAPGTGAITTPVGPGNPGAGAGDGQAAVGVGSAVALVPALIRRAVEAAWSLGLATGAGGSGEGGGPAAPAGGSGPRAGDGGSSPFDVLPGLSGDGEDPSLRLFTVGLVSSAAAGTGFAALLFGRRRRDERQPASDEDLAAAAATAYELDAGTLGALAAGVAIDPGTGGTDVNLPRWRRPSLLEARKFDPVRDARAHASVTFGTTSSAPGRERWRVRYRIVQLLDRPDELLGTPITSLDEGDEVEVVDRHGLYRRVVTPDGRQGWLHRMTLGEVTTSADAASSPEPEAGETILAAYLAARART